MTPKHNALLRPYIQPNEYHTKILSSNLCSIFQWITHQDNHSQALWSKGPPNGIVLLSISLLWTSKCEVSQAPFHSKGTIAQIIIRYGRHANETPVEHIRQLKEIDAPIGSLAVIDKKRGKIWYTARKRVQKSQRQPICPCGANRTLTKSMLTHRSFKIGCVQNPWKQKGQWVCEQAFSSHKWRSVHRFPDNPKDQYMVSIQLSESVEPEICSSTRNYRLPTKLSPHPQMFERCQL
jgi:hypothetical protein